MGSSEVDPDLVRLLSPDQDAAVNQQQALQTLQPVAESLQASVGPVSPDADRILAAEVTADCGRILSQAGRNSDALPFLENATRVEPSNADTWEWLSGALIAQGRDDESQLALQESQLIRGSGTDDRNLVKLSGPAAN